MYAMIYLRGSIAPEGREAVPLDKKILKEYCDMKAEIKELQRIIVKTENRLEKIKKDGDVSDVVSGGMGGMEHFKVTGFPEPEHGKVKRLLQNRRMRLRRKKEELLELTDQIEMYIDSIEKSEIRIMFRLYYIEGLNWAAVAMRMNDLFPKRKVAYTEENCRQKNKRFFEEI